MLMRVRHFVKVYASQPAEPKTKLLAIHSFTWRMPTIHVYKLCEIDDDFQNSIHSRDPKVSVCDFCNRCLSFSILQQKISVYLYIVRVVRSVVGNRSLDTDRCWPCRRVMARHAMSVLIPS